MSLDTGNGKAELRHDLPPVEPPSAKFIVQLFIIPAVIVLVLVTAYLAFVQLPFGRLANGGRDVMDYVRSIKSTNGHRRWRSAQDLANLINNDNQLAKDSRLLGELTALLDDELRNPKEKAPQLPEYLALALGTFQTLKADPVDGRAVDPVASLIQALDKEQPTVVRVAAAIGLGRMGDRFGPAIGDGKAARALIAASATEDAEVRARSSYALGYFPGPESVKALDERISGDEDPTTRYNAGAALARLGSPTGKDTIREMLSPADLAQTVKRPSASETETAIQAIELEALWGLQAAPRSKEASQLLKGVRVEVEGLAKAAPGAVQVEAKNLLKRIQDTD